MDRVNWFFLQSVASNELNLAFEKAEAADRALAVDSALLGITSGLGVTQHAGTPNISVDIAAGVAYDAQGRRIEIPALQNLALDTDGVTDVGGTTFLLAPVVPVSTSVSSGKERVVSVFVQFAPDPRFGTTVNVAQYDQRTDGNNLPVLFRHDESFCFVVTQGGEAAPGTAAPPPLIPGAILICDITRRFGQTQILGAPTAANPVDGDISIARRQDLALISGSPLSVRATSLKDAVAQVLAAYNAHVNGTADKHPATAITTAVGPNWLDSTTNPASDVQTQLAKVVTDLSGTGGAAKVGVTATTGTPNSLLVGSVKSQLDALLAAINAHIAASNAHAAALISYAGNSQGWADNVAHPVGTVESQLDKIVEDLGGDNGGTFIGAAAYGSSPFALTTGSIKSQVNQLRDFLAGLAAGQINYGGSAAWADGTVVNAGTLEAAVDEVVSDLASSGAQKIGVVSIGTWNSDGSNSGQFGDGTIASVQEALQSIVDDLKKTGLSGDSGAARIGAPAQSNGGYSVNAGSIRAQILEILGHIASAAGSGVTSISNVGTGADLVETGSGAATIRGINGTGGITASVNGQNIDVSGAAFGQLAAAQTWSAIQTFGLDILGISALWMGANGNRYWLIDGTGITPGSWLPNLDNQYSAGNNSVAIKDVYAYRLLAKTGQNLSLGAGNATKWKVLAAAGDFEPDADATSFVGTPTKGVHTLYAYNVRTGGGAITHNGVSPQIVPYSLGGTVPTAGANFNLVGGATTYRAAFPSAPSTYTPTMWSFSNIDGGGSTTPTPWPGAGNVDADSLIMRRQALQCYIPLDSGAAGENAWWSGRFSVS